MTFVFDETPVEGGEGGESTPEATPATDDKEGGEETSA